MDQNEKVNFNTDFPEGKGKMHDIITLTDKGMDPTLYQLIRTSTKDEPTVSMTEIFMKGRLDDVLSEIIQPEHVSINVDKYVPKNLSYCHIQYGHAINEGQEFEKVQLAATLFHDDDLYELYLIMPAEKNKYGVHYRNVVQTLTLPDRHVKKETYQRLCKRDMWAGSLSGAMDVCKMISNVDDTECWLYMKRPDMKDCDLLPEDLQEVVRLAAKHGCSRICLTNDGDYVDGLPIYQW